MSLAGLLLVTLAIAGPSVPPSAVTFQLESRANAAGVPTRKPHVNPPPAKVAPLVAARPTAAQRVMPGLY